MERAHHDDWSRFADVVRRDMTDRSATTELRLPLLTETE